MPGVSTPFLFPFCASTTGTVGSGTNYPIGLSLDDCMRWYWRISSWTVTMDGVMGSPPAEIDLNNLTKIVGSSAGSESELICGSFIDGLASYQSFYNNVGDGHCITPGVDSNTFDSDPSVILPEGGSPPTIEYQSRADIVLAFRLFTLNPRVILSGGLYYPSIVLGASCDMQDLIYGYTGSDCEFLGNIFYIQSGISISDPGTPSDTPITIDGNTVYAPSVTITGTGGITSISVVPASYWPYNPGSGGDIWDTSTGAQLRDPFSVQTWT